MSQDFKLKFDENKENALTDKTAEENNPDYYPTGGNMRTLAFVWPDGRMQFFNYSYLITCSYNPEQGSITLEFSTHHVEIKGLRLELLFQELTAQLNKVIRCADKRYKSLDKSKASIVQEITIIDKMQ